MKFLLNGNPQGATLFRSKTIRVGVLNDDGSPYNLLSSISLGTGSGYTVTVATLTTVTASAGTPFANVQQGDFITIAGVEYQIASRTSDTVLVLASSAVNGAGQAVTSIRRALTVVVNIFATSTAVSTSYALTVTPDPTLGTYGIGTVESPAAAGLLPGSTWYGRLMLDDGSGTFGKVVGATLTNPGVAVPSMPTVVVDGQGLGTGASVTITLTPGTVSSTKVTAGGTGLSSTSPPTVTVTGGSPAIPAVFQAVVTGPVTSAQIFAGGLYASTPTVGASDGQGAVFVPTMALPMYSATVSAGGTGYVNGYHQILPGNGITGYVYVTGGVVTRVDIRTAVANSSTVALTWANKATSGSGATFTYNRLSGSIINNAYGVIAYTDSHDTVFGSTLTWTGQFSFFGHVEIFRKQDGTLAISVEGSGLAASTTYTCVVSGGPFGGGCTLQIITNGSAVITSATVTAGSIAALTFYATSNGVTSTFEASHYRVYADNSDTQVYFPTRGLGPTPISYSAATANPYGQGGTLVLAPGSGMTAIPQFYWSLTNQGVSGSITGGLSLAYGTIESVTGSGGAGYKSNSPLTFIGGQQVATASGAVTAINGSVTSLTTVYPGLGYLDAPTLGFSTGAAAATAFLLTTAATLTVASQGSGYRKQPQLNFTFSSAPSTAPAGTLTLGKGNQVPSSNLIILGVE